MSQNSVIVVAVHCVTRMCYLLITYVTSNMITTNDTVILVAPPSILAAPIIAYVPGITQTLPLSPPALHSAKSNKFGLCLSAQRSESESSESSK